jgi:broad specificity phosphatase PhoE
MRQVYLIKHASPQTQPGVPSDQWPLSDAGREAAAKLAQKLADAQLTAIVSSTEPKAIQTTQILSEKLGIAASQGKWLHEHERRHVPYLRTAEFISLMAQVFRRPNDLILGEETALDAVERFQDGLDAALKKHPEGNLAIVTHGTVIALYIATISQEDGYQLWRKMGLPSYAVIQDPDAKLLDLVPSIT